MCWMKSWMGTLVLVECWGISVVGEFFKNHPMLHNPKTLVLGLFYDDLSVAMYIWSCAVFISLLLDWQYTILKSCRSPLAVDNFLHLPYIKYSRKYDCCQIQGWGSPYLYVELGIGWLGSPNFGDGGSPQSGVPISTWHRPYINALNHVGWKYKINTCTEVNQ